MTYLNKKLIKIGSIIETIAYFIIIISIELMWILLIYTIYKVIETEITDKLVIIVYRTSIIVITTLIIIMIFNLRKAMDRKKELLIKEVEQNE